MEKETLTLASIAKDLNALKPDLTSRVDDRGFEASAPLTVAALIFGFYLYATYCMVLGLEASQEFILSQPDLEGCLIYDNDGAFRIWTSPGFLYDDLAFLCEK